ncbi:uncharacterized protein LOC121836018 [Ixodes scapularis]|uniref:uncharacterized protein LOC121836018 n=1 Tax=Ixodes scapularis TaxID=6945 RepID=UPI001C38084F|nr:uncharacterized protein LOC121836018 [Ixodes scapularis]
MVSSFTVVVLGVFIAVLAAAEIGSSFPDNIESQNVREKSFLQPRTYVKYCTYGRWRWPDGTLCKIRHWVYGYCKNGVCSIPTPSTTTARPVPPPGPTPTPRTPTTTAG